MKTIRLSEIFDISYGNSYALQNLEIQQGGIAFVARGSQHNGIVGYVAKTEDEPFPSGCLTVSLGGSVLETFFQPQPFYTAYHIKVLTPKNELTEKELLYYCMAIRANKYRYNYGRQANKTLADILIPHPEYLPQYIRDTNKLSIPSQRPFHDKNLCLADRAWKWFQYKNIFTIKKGKRLIRGDMNVGKTPFIGAIDSKNGYRDFITRPPIYKGNTITVNYNGSVAKAFFQPVPYWASDDCNVLCSPNINQYTAMFLVTIIEKERYRYNYGRKWHIGRMKESLIKLPVTQEGIPDWQFMEDYIKSLPYSKGLEL